MKHKLILIAFALAAFLSAFNGAVALLKTAAAIKTVPIAVAGSPESADDQGTADKDPDEKGTTQNKSWGG
jgi:hypothetical protein